LKKSILAKSDNKKGQKRQSLIEHTKDLLNAYNEILSQENNINLENKENIRLACLLHDLGKANGKFQRKIELANKASNFELTKDEKSERKEINDLNHNILSGAFLKNIFKKMNLSEKRKNILYKAIMLHHGYFMKYFNVENTYVEESIYYDIQEAIFEKGNYNIEELDKFINETLDISVSLFEEDFLDYDYLKYLNESFEDDKSMVEYIMCKGYLNLIDHLASSQIKEYNYYIPFNREILDENIKSIIRKKNKKIKEVKFKQSQEFTKNNINENILTMAFTGSGKTVADHRWFNRRKFFLVPNKISAESFYMEFLELYEGENNVGLLHGDIHLYTDDKKDKSDENEELYISLKDESLVRNFAKPYIIATIDQLILTMYKYPGYEKVFASICNSNVTVDEVHLLEPKMFLMLIYFMEFCNKHLNTKFHLMTATLPKFYMEKLENSAIEFEKNDSGNSEKNEKRKLNIFLDTKETEIKEIVKANNRNKKVLIVVNTIDRGIVLYEQLSKIKGLEVNLLHSRFKFKDKKVKFKDILNQEGDVWISTQMVEISLDLDFPILISDSAPMDSIIQRMGRCNRHDTVDYGEFYILKDNKDVYEKKLKDATKKILKEYNKKTMYMLDRKKSLDDYYSDDKVIKYYDDEFKKADQEIRELYGLSKDTFMTGEDLMLNFEPYKNMVDTKKEASKLYRDGQMNRKIMLEEDYEELHNQDDRTRFISDNSIVISDGIFRKMKKKKAISEKKGIYTLTKGYYSYSQKQGFVAKVEMGIDDRLF
jgi:CRISPR-associated helicase Cas3/CRISPR-associated endonuclease Cas3-HD